VRRFARPGDVPPRREGRWLPGRGKCESSDAPWARPLAIVPGSPAIACAATINRGPDHAVRSIVWCTLAAMLSRLLAAAPLACLLASCGNVSTPRNVGCGDEVLPNRSFDLARPAWGQDPATPSLLCGAPRITPADGTQAACLGGTDGTTQTLTMNLSLPAGVKTVTLTGQICIATTDTAKVDHDVLQFDLLDGATVIASIGKYTNQQGTAACAFAPFELTAMTTSDPVTATMRIRSTLDANLPTSFYVDALAVTTGCGP
jgi:hypothetical protein